MSRIFLLLVMFMSLTATAAVQIIEEDPVPTQNIIRADNDLSGVVKPTKVWKLTEGKTISKELTAWGKSAEWKVIWQLKKDWTIPADTTFTGDFKTAATEVIKTLAANGLVIRAQFFDGNKTLVVYGPGVAEQ